MSNELPDQKDQKIKDLTQRVQTLESQYKILAIRVRKNSKLAKQRDIGHDRELVYLKKVLMGVVLSFGIWSFAGDRVQSANLSDENASTLIEVVGWVLSGGVGITAISQTQKHIEDDDENKEDDLVC